VVPNVGYRLNVSFLGIILCLLCLNALAINATSNRCITVSRIIFLFLAWTNSIICHLSGTLKKRKHEDSEVIREVKKLHKEVRKNAENVEIVVANIQTIARGLFNGMCFWCSVIFAYC